jgi:hypothetical protein
MMKYVLCLILAAVNLVAADATGKWTGTLTVRTPEGSERAMPARLELKQEGAKLSGTAGEDASDRHPIENGKAEGGRLTFEVSTGETTMKFALNHEGDEIKGDITRERDGQLQTAKLAVKRDK